MGTSDKKGKRHKPGQDSFRMEPEQSIGVAVRETYLAFKSAMAAKFRAHRITSAQWAFLRVLWAEDGLGQKELATRVGVHPTTAVSALDVLETNGWVVRQRSETDRRLVNIYLTEAGQRLAAELLPFAAELNETASRDISDAEMQVLLDLLARLRVNLAG